MTVSDPHSVFMLPMKWWHLQYLIAHFLNPKLKGKQDILCPDSSSFTFLVMALLHGIFDPLQLILSGSPLCPPRVRKALLPHSPTVSRSLHFCLEQPIGLTQLPKWCRKYLQISLFMPCLTLKSQLMWLRHNTAKQIRWSLLGVNPFLIFVPVCSHHSDSSFLRSALFGAGI